MISVFVKDPSTFINKVQTLTKFENLKSPIYIIVPTLKMEVVRSTKAMVPTYQIIVLHNTEHSNMSDVIQHNTLECPQPSNKASNPTTVTPATKHLLLCQHARFHTLQLARVLQSLSQYVRL
jgi:hypothetical protein